MMSTTLELARMADRGAVPAAGHPELTVDLTAVANNCRQLSRGTSAQVMAVVKADGFGHGAAAVARTALGAGASWLGVTALSEAVELRSAGLVAPVLSWLNPVDTDFRAAIRGDIDLAVPSRAHLAAVADAARVQDAGPARVHLHLDTGLARDGASAAQWPELCRAARAAELAGAVRVVGVMGHLARADEGPAANDQGKAAFATGVAVAREAGLRPMHRHLAATAAALSDRSTHHTMVRVGAGLVGIDPSGTTRLRPTLTLTAPVVSVRDVLTGTGVGYGHAWTAPTPTTLGLLPVGYADGLPRVASGRAQVWVGGRRRSLVGRISMDQVVVDLGRGSAVAPGDVATVVGAGTDGAPTAADWAGWSDTLEHEMVTGLGSAPARVRRRLLPDRSSS